MKMTKNMEENDNRQTTEAAEVREGSEFIRRVEDFARYMQKEYIDGQEGLSLMINAADGDGEARYRMAHIMLGDRHASLAAAASMLQQDGFREMVEHARRIAGIYEDGQEDVQEDIRTARRRLMAAYGCVAFIIAWTLGLVGLAACGAASWISTVSNMLLMAWCSYLVGREIVPLRRRIRKLREAERSGRTEALAKRVDAMASFLEALRKRMEQDEDDDE